jgi:general secretion pathway protein L
VYGTTRQVEANHTAALRFQTVLAEQFTEVFSPLRQDAEKLSREASFLTKRKRSEPAMVDVINELSRVIPNNTWLYGLQYKDRRLVIQGQSPSASSLIAVMEASPYLHNTSFVSPVTKDVSSGFERFQIASQVLNGRFPDSKSETPGSRTQEPE